MTDAITQACPKCPTSWTATELLPCPECGYAFPSRPASDARPLCECAPGVCSAFSRAWAKKHELCRFDEERAAHQPAPASDAPMNEQDLPDCTCILPFDYNPGPHHRDGCPRRRAANQPGGAQP